MKLRKVIQGADLILACLSSQSVDCVDYAQNEVNMALTEYRKRPRESIYLMPVRLDDCDVPDLKDLDNGLGLRSIHRVDLFEENRFDNLLRDIETKLGDKTISTGAGSRYWHYLSALAVRSDFSLSFSSVASKRFSIRKLRPEFFRDALARTSCIALTNMMIRYNCQPIARIPTIKTTIPRAEAANEIAASLDIGWLLSLEFPDEKISNQVKISEPHRGRNNCSDDKGDFRLVGK